VAAATHAGRRHFTVSGVPDPGLEYVALMVPTQSPWNHSPRRTFDALVQKYV
jgi:hypothetical protein